jgi:hypothetical protein
MDRNMTDLNEEMRATADFAVNSAKIDYRLDLDYSEESLAVLDNILGKVYWEYSSEPAVEKENSLIYNKSIIWGAYLGEYMRLKWSGTWVLNGNERRVMITGIEFSPINFIYKKITNHPEYKVENYVEEAKKVVYASVIHPQKSRYFPENIGQPEQPVHKRLFNRPIHIDQRLVYALAGIIGIVIIVFGGMAGYSYIKSGSARGLSFLARLASTRTATLQPTSTATATVSFTHTPSPTITKLPTYTPKPTNTLRPSSTPYSTFTPLPTSTSTSTATSTSTKIPLPFWTLTPTQTKVSYNPPPPTIPLPVIVSCEVDPSTVPPNTNVSITFVAHFSFYSPGLGFTASNNTGSGCSADNIDSNGMAWCVGSSGMLPPSSKVTVTLRSSVGNCKVSYSSSEN